MDQRAHLRVGDAARCRAGDGGGDGRIHAVGVDGEVVGAARRDALQHCRHADLLQLDVGDQVGAVVERRLDIRGPRTAGGAQTDLEYVTDVVHFRGAADRAGEALAHAADVVAPVQVRVHVHQRHRPLQAGQRRQGAEHRDRHPVVAAERDDHGTSTDDLTRRFLGETIVLHRLVGGARHVAAIDDADVLAVE